KPTLLISHARSGDSPESVATIELAEKLINNVYFLNITCNKNGKMAKSTVNKENCLNIFMPEESNDEGFAMTSSFTCMLLTDLMLPHMKEIENKKDLFEKLAEEAERIIEEDAKSVEEISKIDYNRLVYLGSGGLKGCAAEAALKSLELSHGIVNTNYNTPLGFRHGPKSVINDKTLLGFFVSNNPYTQKYDLDLIREIANEAGMRKLMTFIPTVLQIEGVDYIFELKQDFSNEEEAFLIPLYIIYAQMLAFYKSLHLGITPDNPNPEGRVNRVVKGVTIYEYV
ncbi:MAG TPA: tagatose-6-phosphate ketose isomerase, partial [Tissierellaceae bacterium]